MKCLTPYRLKPLTKARKTKHGRLLEEGMEGVFEAKDFVVTSTIFYRSDDVYATVYFYLDKPESNLPELPKLKLRMKDLDEKVYKALNGFK